MFAMLCVVASGSTQESAPFVGILQNTMPNLQRHYDAGARMAHVALIWNRVCPTEGAWNQAYLDEKKAEVQKMRQAGYAIMLDFGAQYPPEWIYGQPNSRYRNQYGDAYAGGIGETGVNVVFNAKLREMLGAYVTGVLADFGKDVDIVRLGLMRYSEIGYPHPSFKGRKNAYWAYDDIAQGKVEGLPAGVKPCPVPGWTPGRPSADHVDARRFAAWYVDALANFHDWQIELVARQYEGRMAMLYPSWGIREGQLESAVLNDLNGTTSAERNGEIQRAFAFKRFIEGIQNPRVMVCGTWIDSRPEWSDDDAPNPKNPCPIGHLSSLAAAHPLKLRVMGENTGGGGMAAMQLTFQRARRYGLDGVMWAFERDLHDGKPPTLEDLAPCIRAFSQRRQLP